MIKFFLILFFWINYSGALPIESESDNGPSGDIPLSFEAIDEILRNDKEFIDPNDLDTQTKRDNGDLVIEQIHETGVTVLNDYPTESIINTQYDSQPSSGGDTTKTLLSYTLLANPAATATLNGYRQTTVLQNGTLIGGTGVSIDIKQNTGKKLTASIGALRPDQSESTVVHIAGNGKLYNATKTSIGFNAKASHVVGGSDNGKSSLDIKPNYRHKIQTNIGKLVDTNDTLSTAFIMFALASAIQNFDRQTKSKN